VHELILDQLPATYPPPSHFTSRACVFGIQSTALFTAAGTIKQQPNFTLLGDTFLRSAYVVYDLSHHQIGLAQANLNSSSSTIIELSSSGTSLPRVTGVAAQQTTFTPTATARGFGPGGGVGGDGSLFGVGDGAGDGEENAAGVGAAARIPVSGMVGTALVTGLFVLLGGAFVVF
jgi:hypothetical protein